MCGIGGFLLARSPPRGVIEARLAISDLSTAAIQPVSSQDGMVRLTFNGEICNFVEIRHDLEALGHAFKSRDDAEIIANGRHAWGTRIFDRLPRWGRDGLVRLLDPEPAGMQRALELPLIRDVLEAAADPVAMRPAA
ncbi:MAG: hypothetical protein ACREFB_19595 [Stellaceae bacterium]